MTPAQFAALSDLLRLRGGPATDAARLMLVDGLTAIQAAERAGVSRQAAGNAASRCRRGLKLAQTAAGVDFACQPPVVEFLGVSPL